MKTFDPEERQQEKQKSRDQDAEDLISGRKTREQLRFENGIFVGSNAIICWDEINYKDFGMNGEEVLEKFKAVLNKHNVKCGDLAREEYFSDEENYEELQLAFDQEFESELGSFKVIKNGRMDFWHDSAQYVIHFKDHDVYLAFDGWYSSHEGSNFDDAEPYIAKPVEKTYIDYENSKQ